MKDVIISITGIQQTEDGKPDSIELVTDGKYSFSKDDTTLSYMESSLTGLEGTQTIFSLTPEGVVLTRKGSICSRMIFEEGKKHFFVYDTPYGAATMGVDTHRITSSLGEHGGNMEIDYIVDFEHTVIGHNKFRINVRECDKGEVQCRI